MFSSVDNLITHVRYMDTMQDILKYEKDDQSKVLYLCNCIDLQAEKCDEITKANLQYIAELIRSHC